MAVYLGVPEPLMHAASRRGSTMANMAALMGDGTVIDIDWAARRRDVGAACLVLPPYELMLVSREVFDKLLADWLEPASTNPSFAAHAASAEPAATRGWGRECRAID